MGNLEEIGRLGRELILEVAYLLTRDWVPGFVSFVIFAAALSLIILMAARARWQIRAVHQLAERVETAREEYDFALRFPEITTELADRWSRSAGPRRRLHAVWIEYRETLVEPAEEGGVIRNAIRPAAFFNAGNLGFGLRGWRFWPGLFVSVGLLLTFLGLVAALQQTSFTLERASHGANESAMADALNQLLRVASAKFIMSLSGLFASIAMIASIRWCDAGVDRAISRLANALEDRLQFISIEALAQRQLEEAAETRRHMAKLNTELIAAIAEPLRTAAEAGGSEAARVMESVGREMSATLSETVTEASKRMETAASGMANTTAGLDAVSRRIEMVAGELAKAGEILATAAAPLAESIRGTGEASRIIAQSSVELVEKAREALARQSDAIVVAGEAMQAQVEAFEDRAKVYDSDMARALDSYRRNLDAAVEKVSRFSSRVHDDYADALQRLQAVIDSARAFEPASEESRGDAGDVPQ
ncbi:hypothetical protein L0F51_01590 [Afifella sp. H1R]|uniref:hypothetical protein n=1 Tax=Afifella sp. H1R TaxID=2908841 RepID=UPI001F3EA799|nr:hypothetical protein [Afifella sp. H1R]MCF1502458.1 hypothetical protein [Afifella sp. H1R]